MKKLFKSISYKLLHLFYSDLNKELEPYSLKELYSYAFRQKIRGYNRKIPWPVHFTSQIKDYKNIQRGNKYPGYGPDCYIDARCGIIFEENVITAPKISMISQNHSVQNFSTYIESSPIVIRKNSWIATGATILPGVELGEHTIVAAGAVVTKSFPEGNQLIGGNPARVIKKLDNYKEATS
ncbi:MAG: acyltransferase [Bacteroidetes bacterium]|nr:acyltransferase [Bacteroidota bacterium]